MLTIEEIRQKVIQPDVAKEAYLQAEKRLSDLLETKKSLEQRASSLLTVFVTLALALIGAGSAFLTVTALAAQKCYAIPFFAASIPLLIAAYMVATVLRPADYGALGSEPRVWLIAHLIDAPENFVPKMTTYLTHGMQKGIEASQRSNDKRADSIVESTFFAIAPAPVLIIGALLVWALSI